VIGLSGRPTSLTLTTIESEESESASWVISLQVMDLEGRMSIVGLTLLEYESPELTRT